MSKKTKEEEAIIYVEKEIERMNKDYEKGYFTDLGLFFECLDELTKILNELKS